MAMKISINSLILQQAVIRSQELMSSQFLALVLIGPLSTPQVCVINVQEMNDRKTSRSHNRKMNERTAIDIKVTFLQENLEERLPLYWYWLF